MKHKIRSLSNQEQGQGQGQHAIGVGDESSYADDVDIDIDIDGTYLSNGQYNADSSAHGSTPILQNTFDDDGSSIFGPLRKTIQSFSASR